LRRGKYYLCATIHDHDTPLVFLDSCSSVMSIYCLYFYILLAMKSSSNKKEWFETWFDTPYYHLLYENRNHGEAEQFIVKLLKYLNLSAGANALDVACGIGRFSIALAKHNLNVVGIDLSLRNIEHTGIHESENLSFYQHDMREIFYVNYFDAVFNMFTSFGFFNLERDHLKSVRAMSHALKKGGKLVIDFFNSEKILKTLIPQQQFTKNNILFNIRKSIEENQAGFTREVIVKKIYFQDKGTEHEFEERVMALRLADFKKYFEANHLKLVDVFGDYNLNAFDEMKSDRMILIAEKT